MGSSLNSGPLLGVLFYMRVPYYIGDLKRDPTLENYPYIFWRHSGARAQVHLRKQAGVPGSHRRPCLEICANPVQGALGARIWERLSLQSNILKPLKPFCTSSSLNTRKLQKKILDNHGPEPLRNEAYFVVFCEHRAPRGFLDNNTVMQLIAPDTLF